MKVGSVSGVDMGFDADGSLDMIDIDLSRFRNGELQSTLAASDRHGLYMCSRDH